MKKNVKVWIVILIAIGTFVLGYYFPKIWTNLKVKIEPSANDK